MRKNLCHPVKLPGKESRQLSISNHQSQIKNPQSTIVNRGSRPSRLRLAEDFRRKSSIAGAARVGSALRRTFAVNHNNSAPGQDPWPRPHQGGQVFAWAGFTLIELLVAVSLAAMIMLVTAMIFKQASKAFSESDARNEVYQNVRAAFDVIKRDISGAVLNADYEWFKGEPNTITFLSSTSNDNDQPITLIKYFLNGNTLNKSENTDTAFLNASISSFGAATTTGILGFNVSTLQFMYRDTDGTWGDTWVSTATEYLPDAVEVKMTISDMQNRYTGTSTSIISIR